ncbi:ABC transporter permease [Roseateles cavernae]|uniref:ABC transporter permease n=1 Tax=Roseateles cavernae TaxID=3153578 RepID=UPI0032E3DB61
MLIYILRRLLVACSVMLTVAVLSFMLLHLSGDLATAIAGAESTSADIEKIRVQYGLDRPITTQFFDWLGAAARLDFGRSFYFQNTVMELIGERLPITLKLGAVALLLAVAVAIPLGVLAAIYRDSWVDRVALMIAVVGQAMPNFWFALTLILIFAVGLQWLPVAGNESWLHFVLPAIALGYYAMPSLMRLTRAGMLDVLGSDYIRTARAKGLSPARVVFKHALRNAIIPVVALAAVELGFMLGGSVVIESVYSLQGLGQLAWDSIARNDYPVVQAVVLIIASFYIALTFLADVLNAALDPRMRTKE